MLKKRLGRFYKQEPEDPEHPDLVAEEVSGGIEEMMEYLSGVPPKKKEEEPEPEVEEEEEEKPAEEEESVEEEKEEEDQPAEEEEEESEEEEEPEEESEEGEEEKAGEEEDPEKKALEERNQLLQKRLNEMAGKLLHLGTTEEEPRKGEEEAPPEKKEEAPPIKPQEFVSEEEFDAAMRSKEGLNALMSKVYDSALEAALRSVGTSVPNMISREVALTDAAREFFRERPSLRPMHNYIGARLNDLQSANPGDSVEQLFEKLGKEVDAELGAVSEIQKGEEATKKRRKPPQPGQSAKRTKRRARKEKGKALSQMEQEIAEMMEFEGLKL
jgi:hypothetical protein